MTESQQSAESQGQGDGGQQEQGQEQQAFTQADVDRIVRERVQRERSKFADYDDLKAKAGEKVTLEERVAQIESQARESEQRAIRAEVANAKGLTPTQAKRLVGATREELEADADELLRDLGAQKKSGNRVAREGHLSQSAAGDDKAFVRQLFGNAG